MPYRGDPFAQGHYYHIYNRGAGKQRLFFQEAHYRHLLHLVGHYVGKHRVTLIAYCLMPNHYHFLLRQETEEPLSKFINVLFSSYVQALNRQQGRSGTLFQGRFRYKLIPDLAYVLRLARYIHMNPVKAGLVSCPEEWPYSDYGEWAGLRKPIFGYMEFARQQFPTGQEYRVFIANANEQAEDYEKLMQYVWD